MHYLNISAYALVPVLLELKIGQVNSEPQFPFLNWMMSCYELHLFYSNLFFGVFFFCVCHLFALLTIHFIPKKAMIGYTAETNQFGQRSWKLWNVFHACLLAYYYFFKSMQQGLTCIQCDVDKNIISWEGVFIWNWMF